MGIKGKDRRSIQGVAGASQPVRRALGQVGDPVHEVPHGFRQAVGKACA